MTLAGVLTEDATWTVNIAGEVEQGPFVGRPAILDLVREATEAQTDQRRHNLVNMVFRRADADTAVVWAYLMLTSNAGGASNVITTGFYTITLRNAESEWRIAKLFVGMDNAE